MGLRPSRPGGVTWLAAGVFLLAAGNTLRAVNGLHRQAFLEELELSVPPAYLILSGAFWALAGLALAAGLWRGAAWAGRLTFPAALVYSAHFWVDRLALAASSLANLNWPFTAGVNALALAVIWLVLRRTEVRRFLLWAETRPQNAKRNE